MFQLKYNDLLTKKKVILTMKYVSSDPNKEKICNTPSKYDKTKA